jgi:acyl-coenzyme A synthetase/AMP-(fatty) acid ligase
MSICTATTASAIACRTRSPRCSSPTRRTPRACPPGWWSTSCCSTTSLLDGADDTVRARGHARRGRRPALLLLGTTGLAKGILHAHRYLLGHEEFIYCHDVQDGELFHGMGEWAWAAGIAPLLGPWRLGAVQLVYQREGGFDPHKQLDVLSRHEASNVFTTPTAMRSMMAIGDAGTRYPQKFRIVCSAGEPLNPEAIRWFREQYGLTVLDYYGLTESYPLCANYPVHGCARGLDGQADAGWDVQILDEDEQPLPQGERGEICLRARRTRTIRSATGTTTRRRRRRSAATGSTPRTRPASTRTATSGTRAARTT